MVFGRQDSVRAEFVACLIEYLTCVGETAAAYRLVCNSTIDNRKTPQAAAPPQNWTPHPTIQKSTTSTSDSKVAMARSTDVPSTIDNSASVIACTRRSKTQESAMNNNREICEPLDTTLTPQRSVNTRINQHTIELVGPLYTMACMR